MMWNVHTYAFCLVFFLPIFLESTAEQTKKPKPFRKEDCELGPNTELADYCVQQNLDVFFWDKSIEKCTIAPGKPCARTRNSFIELEDCQKIAGPICETRVTTVEFEISDCQDPPYINEQTIDIDEACDHPLPDVFIWFDPDREYVLTKGDEEDMAKQNISRLIKNLMSYDEDTYTKKKTEKGCVKYSSGCTTGGVEGIRSKNAFSSKKKCIETAEAVCSSDSQSQPAS